MNTLTRLCISFLLAVLNLTTVDAAVNSPARVRAFAKLPDWSGLWEQFDLGANGSNANEEEDKKFIAVMSERPPYNTEWQARYDAAVVQSASKPDAIICTFGYPQLMVGSPLMFQAIVTPEETTLIFNQRETRHIYTDGRAHPPLEEMLLSRWGHSIGHWEGQTLSTDTIGTSSALVYFEANGKLVPAPFSDTARYLERLHLVDANTLENQIEIIDPISLKQNWKLTRRYHRVPNLTELIDEDCLGNDRNPVVDGKFILAPP